MARTKGYDIKSGIAAALLALAVPGMVQAQALEIAPLTLDIEGDAGETLVLAALDTPNVAPTIDGLAVVGAGPLAIPVAAGLPTPSLILGRIAPGQEASFGIASLLPETVASLLFDLDDLDAREALRARDAALFEQLINEGHLDPSADDLNRVLQVELQRMDCYRSGIDGAWGPGSRRAVGEYFDELSNVSWPNQDPSPELFRTILINGDVPCAAPVVQTTQRPAASTTTASRPAAQPTPQPAPQPAAPATNQPQLKSGLTLGSGVTR